MLAAAIACGEGRARRRALGERFAAAHEADPAIATLRLALEAGADAIDAARPLLGDTGWLDRCMARAVAGSWADPLFEPPLQPIGRHPREGVRLFAHPRLAISLLRLPAPVGTAGTIGFSGQRSLVRFLNPVVSLNFWRLEEGRCRSEGTRRIDSAEINACDGAREAWSIAPGSSPAILLQATERGVGVPLATYNVTSGALLARTASDGAAMRLQLIASLLCRMGRRDAAAALRDLASEGPPHLRWHIARELTTFSPEAARPLLDELATDGDADLRAVAQTTLALLAA